MIAALWQADLGSENSPDDLPARSHYMAAMANGSLKRKRRTAADAPAQARASTPTGARTITVTEDEAGMRLDRWFKRRIPSLALSHLNKIVRTGQVRVDGARVKTAVRLEAGQNVRVPPLILDASASPPLRRAPSADDARALRDMTLFEDRDLLVLNKPFGLAVQGGSGTTRHIDGMLEALADEGGERPRLVHRLDRDTSGVLLIAKSRRIAADLGEIFRSRQAKKIYWALVEGVPKPAQGRISLFLAKGEGMGDARGARSNQISDRERMRVARHGDADAQHSVTYYAIVDKIAPKLAWLSMKPLTGRTHQLRAHAEAIGHPIIGDPKYGHGRESEERRRDAMRAIPDDVERKLHLLARRLVLPHPRGGTLDVTAPLPPHMQKSFEKFGFDAKQYDPIEGAPEA
jgi:23S rRNA pseudouridine955/2504/2580 synthase